MAKVKSEQNKQWLLNDTIARYLTLIFQGQPNVRLFNGVQKKGQLQNYYFEYLREVHNGLEQKPAQRLVSYHLKNQNHYVLSAVDVTKSPVQVLYFDPLGDANIPEDIKTQYTDTFGKNVQFIAVEHAQQKDGVNCGVYLAINADVVANTDVELSEFAQNPANFFPTANAGELLQCRQQIIETLNEEFDDQYALDKDGAIVMASDVELDENLVPDHDKFVCDANNKIADLLDQGDLTPQDFYKLFKAAEEAIRELDNVAKISSDEKSDKELLAFSVRFFHNENAKFERQIKKATPKTSPRTTCAAEVGRAVNESPLDSELVF